jgi:arylsulfatase A-like enzyme
MGVATRASRSYNGIAAIGYDCLHPWEHKKKVLLMKSFRILPIVFYGALFSVMILSVECFAESSSKARPNFLLVMTDDQGFADLGVRGNPDLRTPHLDRFAKKGLQIPRFYCSPVCAPTRASLMTGRYYYRSGVIHTSRGGAKMAAENVTLAERLRRLGYVTGIFGKWHLGDTYPMRPGDQGFDESLIHKSGGIGQTPDRPNAYFRPYLWENGELATSEQYCTDVFTDGAIAFMKAHRDEPFFLYLPYNAPHTPLQIADAWVEPYREKGLNETTARVYGMIENIDTHFGRLLESLDELKLRRRTVVIFFGDNGPQQKRFSAGLRGRKASVYEGGIRVGAYFQWPGRFPRGKVLEEIIAAHLDIAPTLIELAGGDPSSEAFPVLDGRSLVPLLTGEKEKWSDERTLFFQCHRGLVPKQYQNCAVVTKRYKMIGYPGTFSDESLQPDFEKPHLELYDLLTDPGESQNLVGENQELVRSLRDRYDRWWEDVRRTRAFRPGVIHIGNEAENPTVLCRYQDGNYRNGVPHGWTVCVERGGTYRASIDRGPFQDDADLFIRWQGETLRKPLPRGTDSAEFHLEAGSGVIDIWLKERGGERVVVADNSTTGDVYLRRLFR